MCGVKSAVNWNFRYERGGINLSLKYETYHEVYLNDSFQTHTQVEYLIKITSKTSISVFLSNNNDDDSVLSTTYNKL